MDKIIEYMGSPKGVMVFLQDDLICTILYIGAESVEVLYEPMWEEKFKRTRWFRDDYPSMEKAKQNIQRMIKKYQGILK